MAVSSLKESKAGLVNEADTSMTQSRLWPDILESLLQTAWEKPSRSTEIREDILGALSCVLDGLSGLTKDLTTLQIFSETARAVLKSFAGDEVVLTMLGVKCLDEGMYQQAQYFLQSALKVNPDFLSAKENLRTVFDRVVDRWHFLMLNDITRNSAYLQAIQTAIDRIPHCKVLDIGSGTGILSMMAARQGAEKVYACELSETMVAMSHDILAANGLLNDVNTIHAVSTELSVPRDLPERVSLVVTEIVDAGLLGERIIPTIKHAWAELLSAGGHVIPCGATVYAMAIECPEIRRQSRLLSREVAGLSFGSQELEGSCKAPEEESHLCATPLATRVSGAALTREPYTCERLAQIRGGFRALTGSHRVLEFDFDDPEVPLPPESHFHLPVQCEGMVDAVAVWFELHLDSEVSFCTAPSWDLCWEQALFPMSRDMEVQRGDAMRLLASCSDILLKMEVEEIQRSARTVGECSLSRKEVESAAFLSGEGKMDRLLMDMEDIEKTVAPLESKQLLAVGSTEHEIPSQDDESRKGQTEMEELAETAASTLLRNYADSEKYYVERGELSRLNDSIFMGAYRKAIAEALQVIRETGSSSSSEGSELEDGMTRMMLDPPKGKEQSLNSGDSIPCQELGSTATRLDSGDEGSTESGSEDYADCIVLDMGRGPSLFGLLAAKEGADFIQIARSPATYKPLLEDLAEWNRIKDKISFRYLELSRIPAAQPMWDLVVCDIVSPQGVLRSGVFEELAFLSSHHLHSESLLLPSRLVLHATCLSSAALRAQTSLLGSVPTLGFDIAPFLNHYQVSHFIDIDLCTLAHEVLTESFQLLSLDLTTLGTAPVKEEEKVKVQVKSSGTVTGIAYWFTLQLHGDIVVTTAPGAYPESHWHQAVFLLPADLAVERGQTLEIRGLLRDSCIDIVIVKSQTVPSSDTPAI